MGTVDLLFLARNRLEFTRESLTVLEANTDWRCVDTLYLYDDQSEDGTRKYLEDKATQMPVKTVFKAGLFNSPNQVLMDCVHNSSGSLLCKIDNDALMPPGWLNAGLDVMFRTSELDVLGLGYWGEPSAECNNGTRFGYKPSRFIGGIGIFRRRVLRDLPLQEPTHERCYGGLNQSDMQVAWITPSIHLILLDWLPFQPWIGYSERYEAAQWQRKSGRSGHRNDRQWGWWLEQRKQRGLDGPAS